MKHRLLPLAFIMLIKFAFGQNIHSPAEILQIMEKSPITYEIEIIEESIPPPDRSENLNYNNVYRIEDENGVRAKEYEISEEANKFLDKAEKYYSEANFSKAREMYFKVLESDSNYYEVITYIGQMYESEGDLEKASEWYLKAIDHNYIDYMAHWFLADAYQKLGETVKAIDEITISMILNRNNPRIKKSFDNIYKQNKLKITDWVFNPQIKIDSTGKNKCSLKFGEDWLGYAMVKAVWKFEPGYSESMGVVKGQYSTIEEKEAIVSLVTPLSKKKIKKVPQFKAIKLAMDKKLLDEFILYEIMLPQYPYAAYQLSNETILNIKDYVIHIRGKIK